jgi:hypothetical protein
VQSDGTTRWVVGTVYRRGTIPVERRPASLVTLTHQAPARPITLTIENTFRVGADEETTIGKLRTQVAMEEKAQVGPGNLGTYALRYLAAKQGGEMFKRPLKTTPLMLTKGGWQKLTALLQIDNQGNLRANTVNYRVDGRPPLSEMQLKRVRGGEDLLDFHDPIKDSLNVLSVPLPGKEVAAQENWRSDRFLPVESPSGRMIHAPVSVNYTYLGRRTREGREEVVISMDGTINDPRVGGSLKGIAVLDLATGRAIVARADVAVVFQETVRIDGQQVRIKLISTLNVRLVRPL